jgi:hypothetical protein
MPGGEGIPVIANCREVAEALVLRIMRDRTSVVRAVFLKADGFESRSG